MATKRRPNLFKPFMNGFAPKYIQFSKRLAIAVTLFWMIYRIAQFVVILIQPDVANAMVDMVDGVDKAMMANMAWYTGNSSVEKIALAFVDAKKDKDDKEDEGDEEDDPVEDDSTNG